MKYSAILFCFLTTAGSCAAAGWLDVSEHGVTGDGKTVQTPLVQQLIDETSAQGGGTIYFPPGEYISGTIRLKDNITLHLEAGARILGSERIEDYAPKGLVVAEDAKNIAIVGQGTIDGRNRFWWVDHRKRWTEEEYENHPRRKFSWVPHHVHGHARPAPGTMVKLVDCQNVTIRDVTLKDSENWNLHLLACEDVTIDGIRINSDLLGPNSDGIDIEACQDVTVSNCEVYCGDDAICLKNETREFEHRPCKNITVTNCIITTTCNAFKLGTGTRGDFENITFSNSVIKAGQPDEPLARGAAETLHPDLFDNGLAPLSGIALECVDGGHVRGITISNIVMHGVRAPIFIRRGNRRGLGTIEDISISNVTAYDCQNASMIAGLPGHPVKNVSLSNITIHTDGSGTLELAHKEMPEKEDSYPEITGWGRQPVYGLYSRHVEGLYIDNLRVFADGPDQRPALTFDDVENLHLSRFVTNRKDIQSQEVIRMINGRSVYVSDCFNMTPVETWIRVSGLDTDAVHIEPSFRSIESRVVVGKDVLAGKVHVE
jgi:polygalacturonase